ncbi:uncharacterized protein LOC143449522 [Clavelina lepadiformis]|uniref:uncharacterized protein LOC143449522 n=1 Tax=Clavelina lepadiformis TaxID=159417 RepID=UPI004043825E
MDIIQSNHWAHVVGLFFNMLIVEQIAHRFCLLDLKKFENLSQRKKKELNLEVAFFLFATFASCITVSCIQGDNTTGRDKPWCYPYFGWNCALAMGNTFADLVYRKKWNIKLYPSSFIHYFYVFVIVLAVPLVKTKWSYPVSLRIVTLTPSPIFFLRIMMHRLKLDDDILHWTLKLVASVVDFIFRILLIPLYYHLVLYLLELMERPDTDLVSFGELSLLSIVPMFDVVNIIWFSKVCTYRWDKKYLSEN